MLEMEVKSADACMLFGLLCVVAMITVCDARAVSDAPPILEGDILLTRNTINVILQRKKEDLKRRKRNAIKADVFRWEGAKIPYMISDAIDSWTKDSIKKAFNEYERLTCLKFTPRKDEPDYVEFVKKEGCYSAIGRQGGRQEISIGDGCESRGQILHEIMHSVGFFHMQSRFDRDLYVKILWWNIAPGAEKNFAAYSHGSIDTMGSPYDKNSILHYNNKAFSKNGENTVESIEDPSEPLGQESLSKNDIKQINAMYQCNNVIAPCVDRYEGCVKYRILLRQTCYKDKDLMAKLCPQSCGFC